MPLYEYHCDECDNEFESLQSIRERDDAECPECGTRARRLLSGFAVGSGGGGFDLGSVSSSSSSSCSSGGG